MSSPAGWIFCGCEGKFVADDAVLAELEAKHLTALRYANADGSIATEFPANPNGSLHSIAGICDPTGRVFGLMPHPEAFLSPYNSPSWTADKIAADYSPITGMKVSLLD